MSTRIHINQYTVQSVTVEAHPGHPDLITLSIVNEGARGHAIDTDLAMDRDYWQQVVDQLAGLGVVAGVTLARLAGGAR